MSIASEFIKNNEEEKEIEKEMLRKKFQWLTSIRSQAGMRKNWQKRYGNDGKLRIRVSTGKRAGRGDITHAYSWNINTMKNHYLMTQIADMVKQLHEKFFLKKNELKKKQKMSNYVILSSYVHMKEY